MLPTGNANAIHEDQSNVARAYPEIRKGSLCNIFKNKLKPFSSILAGCHFYGMNSSTSRQKVILGMPLCQK